MSVRCVTGEALTAQDVYDIWKIRDAVFAVEQQVEEEDVDGRDLLPTTTHLWLQDADGPISYLRVYLSDDGELQLNAQSYLERWYESFGYVRSGDDYHEAGILHTPMSRAGR
jgi:ElaA protein